MSEQTTTVAVRPLAEIETEIGQLVGIGFRASQRIAVLVHQAKAQHFENIPEWLVWCADRFGYARRTAFRLAKVGGFLGGLALVPDRALGDGVPDRALVPVHHRALLACDLHRLESLADLHDEKPDQLDGLLRHWNPAEYTIKEVTAKVRSFLGEPSYTLVCQDCKEEFESDRCKKKRCPACQTAYEAQCERDKERRQANAFERHLTALAELFARPEELEPHVSATAPGIAMAASLTAADLALAHVEECGDLSREEYGRWLPRFEAVLDKMRTLAVQAS